MLKEKLDIIAIHTTDGFDVLGKVKSTTDTEIVLTNPRMLSFNQTGQATLVPYGVFAMPADPSAKKDFDVTFNKGTIVCHYTPSEDIKQSYSSSTSGIATPSKNIVTGKK